MQKHVIKRVDRIDLTGLTGVVSLDNVVLHVHMGWTLADITQMDHQWKVFVPTPDPSTWAIHLDQLGPQPNLQEGVLYEITSAGLAGRCYFDTTGLSNKLVGSGPLRGYEALPDHSGTSR